MGIMICNAHFDHLEGDVFEDCKICNYKSKKLI